MIRTRRSRITRSTLPGAAFLLAWLLFWALMLVIAVNDPQRAGDRAWWAPLVSEGTSFVVATVIVAVYWRVIPRLDVLLDRPARWFAIQVCVLPPLAIGFVVSVYTFRVAVHAALGSTYVYGPVFEVVAYEGSKFALFYLLLAAVVFGIRSHGAMLKARVRVERSRMLARQAQLNQLTQQLEPHFLFNSLGLIAETIHTDPDLADYLLTRLSELLRATTDLFRKPEASLAEEVALLKAYATIMQERFADRVTVTFEIDPALANVRVPTLLVQPLLENAFRHGVERAAGPAAITVRASGVNGRLMLSVESNQGLLRPDFIGGTGLSTVRNRLRARFGASATVIVEPRTGGGVSAFVTLPCVS